MKHLLLLTLSLFSYGLGNSSGAVVIGGNFANGTGTLTFTTPLSFTITSSGSLRAIVFQAWAPTDGTTTTAIPAAGSALTYTLNGGPSTSLAMSSLLDHRPSNTGAITAGDSTLTVEVLAVTAGDVITIQPQTISFGTSSGFNPAVTGSFQGSMFLASTSSSSLTAAVPEPSAGIFAGLASIALLRRRRCA